MTARKATWRRFVHQNAYRDVWLLIVTALVLWMSVIAVHGSHKAQDVARQVQQQRRSTVLAACQDQNRRHNQTIMELDQLINTLAPGPARDRARAGRQFTVSLVDALAPYRDCTAAVKQATTGSG